MPSMEALKKTEKFDEILAKIISKNIRQPRYLEIPAVSELVSQVRQRVNPEILMEVKGWGGNDTFEENARPFRRADLRFKPTNEFIRLLGILVEAFGKESKMVLTRREKRRRVNLLKVAAERGVSNIKLR